MARSLRQLFAALLAHHMLGVSVRPVGVDLSCPRLMLTVHSSGAPQRLRQITRRRICRIAGNTPGKTRRDLLQQPGTARHLFAVTGSIRVLRSMNPKQHRCGHGRYGYISIADSLRTHCFPSSVVAHCSSAKGHVRFAVSGGRNQPQNSCMLQVQVRNRNTDGGCRVHIDNDHVARFAMSA